jgi:hypothetical protein
MRYLRWMTLVFLLGAAGVTGLGPASAQTQTINQSQTLANPQQMEKKTLQPRQGPVLDQGEPVTRTPGTTQERKVTTPLTASPADRKLCNNYAHASVNQHKTNQSQGCGFGGLDWHGNLQNHLNWCLKNPSRAPGKVKWRNQALKACQDKKAKAARQRQQQSERRRICNNYAINAVKLHKDNLASNCRFPGDKWHGDQNKHHQWCLAHYDSAMGDLSDRKAMVADCQKRGRAATDRCNNYAREAIRLYQESLSWKCGFRGDVWHSDHVKHFRHCLAAPGQTINNLVDRRNYVADCKARSKKKTKDCNEYARKMVNLHGANLKWRCDFRAEYWHGDHVKHFRRCLDGYGSTIDALPERQARIDTCIKEKKEAAQKCTPYAQDSVTVQNQNLKHKCEYQGQHWHTDRKRHYDWCMHNVNSAPSMLARRRDEIGTCKDSQKDAASSSSSGRSGGRRRGAQPATPDSDLGSDGCWVYTDTAIEQYLENKDHGCGFMGTKWHLNFSLHHDWCKKQSRKTLASHTARRKVDLDKCKRKKPLPRNYCVQYAHSAVKQQIRNARWKCGKFGTAWHTDYSLHYHWCKNASYDKMNKEKHYRENALKLCEKKRNR